MLIVLATHVEVRLGWIWMWWISPGGMRRSPAAPPAALHVGEAPWGDLLPPAATANWMEIFVGVFPLAKE